MMKRNGFRAGRIGAAMLAAVIVLTAQPALAQGRVAAVHGDWEVRCDTPPGAQFEQCAMIQVVAAEDRDNVRLEVIVLRTADRQARLLRVIAPLGVLLPFGLGLRVDGAEIGTTQFVRCFPEGCLAEVILEDDLLARLSAGNTATFVVFLTPEEGIGIPISLIGFSAGFAALP
jgi:invasion protein IalB